MMEQIHQETIKIWKPIKELDAEIRTITKTKDTRGEIVFRVDIGLFESLGEYAGDIITFSYDGKPTEQDIIRDIKENLIELKKELSDTDLLSGRDERQLKVLRRIIRWK